MKLLHIDSSARTSSVTRRLTAKFAEEWRKNHPHGVVIQRDLSATAIPLITDDWNATHLEQSKLTPAQQSYLSTSDELIEELEAADTVVIGAPMYNFTIPSSLKAWIDQIVRLRKTVGYGPNGPQGLLAALTRSTQRPLRCATPRRIFRLFERASFKKGVCRHICSE